MQKKTDKIIDKLVKKDYNNQLEEVLEKKNFDESTKNILLSILYKIEAAYADYEMVKQNVEPKEEFIENIIRIIKRDCDYIKVVKLNSEESKMLGNKTFLVEKGRIICYPIERKLLYCISKIEKKEEIIKDDYYLINKTLSELINVGNCINTVEPIRDFNGYSWITLSREIESITHNLVYQNLRILLGYKFLNNWIRNREYIIDYAELFKSKIEEQYGKRLESEFLEELNKISVLLSIKYNSKIVKQIKKDKQDIEKKLSMMQNNQDFIEEVTNEKRKITKEIKKIDETINNKEMMQEEYKKRNEKLPLENKIFSVRILSKIIEEEREEKIRQIEELNKLLNPKKFIKYKKELEEKIKYLKLVETNDVNKEIKKELLKIQNTFLKYYARKIEKEETKQGIIKLIAEFRYYCLLPFDEENTVCKLKNLEKQIETIKKMLIEKAHELKAIDLISKNKEIDYKILSLIFDLRVINLEKLNIKITKEKDSYYAQLFDENIFEEKIELKDIENIEKKDMQIKRNKKIKIFN